MNRSLAVSLLVLTAAACGTSKTSPSQVADNEDERGSVGVPPTADAYCTDLGYMEAVDATDSSTICVFPDGTQCEVFSFYQGACGQSHSYCNLHGGSIRRVFADAGTFEEVYGLCTLNGIDCQEGNFIATGKCE